MYNLADEGVQSSPTQLFSQMRRGCSASNGRGVQPGRYIQRSSFFEEERSYLKPLPAHSYEPAIWIPSMKVGYDYLGSDGLNKYSVPFDLIGERVDIRTTRNAVEVF